MTEASVLIDKFVILQRKKYGDRFYLLENTLPNGHKKITVVTQNIREQFLNYLNGSKNIEITSLEETEGINFTVLKQPVNLYTKPTHDLDYLADQLTTGENIRALSPREGGWTPVVVTHDFEDQAPKELGWVIYNEPNFYVPDSQALPSNLQSFQNTLNNFLKTIPKIKYRLSGKTEETGFDCSGFVQTVVYQTSGLRLPRLAKWQSLAGIPVNKEDLKLEDLVYFINDKHQIDHVGLVYKAQGDNLPVIVHSSQSANGIIIEDLNKAPWLKNKHSIGGYRRFLKSKS